MKRLLLFLIACLLPSLALAQQPIPSGTGINIHTWSSVGWNNATDMALIREAGFKFVRVDLGWRWTEPQKNATNFTLADGWLAAADANGLRVIFTLDYNNPLWSGSQDDKQGLGTAANREAYARWCERAARHFAGRGVIWEIWNEPNHTPFWKPGPNVDHYSIAGKLAYTAIRQYAGSSDPIIGPASTFSDKNTVDQRTPNNGLTFLNNLFARGQLDFLDGVSVHSYRPQQQGSGTPETVLGFYTALNNVMASYGRRRPIISGEWGYSRTEVSADKQARYLARSLLVNSLAGLPLSIHYNYTDSSSNTTDREANFGIVKHTQPRVRWPAFAAAQAVNRVLNGSTLQSKIITNNNRDFLLGYATSSGTVHVLWTIDTPHSKNAGASPGGYAVTDYLGRPLPNIPAGGSITIDDAPKYLRPIPAPSIADARGEDDKSLRRGGSAAGQGGSLRSPLRDGIDSLVKKERSGATRLGSRPMSAKEFKRNFPMGGKQRSYELHLPPSPTSKIPVVIVLHGGGSNATQARVQTQMVAAGDANRFAVCFPNGTAGYGTAYTWNSGACCGYAFNRQVDDVAFIERVIDDLVARYAIDPRRVYLAGMSNGAQMAWHAGCALAGRKVFGFAAVASCSSVPEAPPLPIPVLQISGLKDTNAPFYGGVGSSSINQFSNLATPDCCQRAAVANGWRSMTRRIDQGPGYERFTYEADHGGPPVVLYTLPEGGHTWPGGVDITAGMGTGPHVKNFNASQVILDFFNTTRK